MKRHFVIIIYLFGVFQVACAKETSHTTEIKSNWEYTHFPYCQTDEDALSKSATSVWKTAIVPGDVHLDLQRDGVLPNLYFA